MKKRILSLVLCAVMLLSMCLFMGAGVTADTDAADGSAESTESTESYIPAVNFTNVAPLVQANTQAANSPARAPMLTANVNAVTTRAADNGVVTSKTATANKDGTYTITLEAYATGSKVISSIEKDIPTDIVLVLDQSGSMAEKFSAVSKENADKEAGKTEGAYLTPDGEELRYKDGKWEYYHYEWEAYSGNTFYSSRLLALKTAVTSFTNAVAEKAAGKDGNLETSDDNIDHRIAVVGFACGQWYSGQNYNYKNTEVFVGKNQYTYGTAAQGQYKNAFQDMNNATGVKNVSDSIGVLAADGGTLTNLGLEMANGIFQSNPITQGETRNRVVVVFTDGVPGWSGYDSDVAQSAIAQANVAKATHSATVYSIGIFAGADATSQGNKSGSETQQANWFMQNLSSNNGVVQNPSYYLSAADAESLKNIFKQISDQIETGGSSTTLSSDAVVKDVISPQFQLPEGTTAKDIQLETYACTGKTGDKYQWSTTSNGNMYATASILSDGQVSVTGFDFAGNWCGVETQTNSSKVPHGNKLVISFKVVPKDGFLGGNDVFTNDSAGIYENSTSQRPVATFERPQVNVPIKDVTVTGADKNVYLLGDLTADQLKAGATASVGGVSLNLNEDNYGLEAWQLEYVDITVKVTDVNGNVITNLSDLKDDVTYSVAVTVAPKTTSTAADAATEQTGINTANVNVFKPELTFKDSEGYYGDTAPSLDGNLTSTVWKHGETVADTILKGEAPALTLTYTPDTDAIVNDKINTRTDFGVAAAVKIGETDVTANTTFQHTPCEGKTCTLPEGTAFLCHVNTCSLKITKTVEGKGANPNQTFVFNVMKGNDLVTTVVLKAGASTTITGLAVGDYTVVEDTAWSWSYTADKDGKADVTLSSTKSNDEAKITNTAKENHWLTSIVDVINKWTANDGKTTINNSDRVPGTN